MIPIQPYRQRDFEHSFDLVLSNDATYGGGDTKFALQRSRHPHENFETMNIDRAKFIHRSEYWDATWCDVLPKEIAFDVYDMAICTNATEAIRALQRAGDVYKVDGCVGSTTLHTVFGMDQRRLLARFNGMRLLLATEDEQWERDGRAWCRRIAANLTAV